MRFSRERPVKVVMLGAGGTGGHIAPHLYRLLYALERPVRFIICDGDVVEQKNLVRQNFTPADLGENKAKVLAERYSAVFGMETEYVPEFIESEERLRELLTPQIWQMGPEYAYGVELDEYRAEEAQTRLHRVGVGSFFHSRISSEAFHLMFLNPPYLSVLTQGGSRARHEKRFLVESMGHLMLGGLLIYVIPYYRLTPDICRILGENFTDLSVWRFTDGEFRKFKQVAVLGLRKKRIDEPSAGVALEQYAYDPDTVPSVTNLQEGRYALPAVPKKVELFKGELFNEKELERQLSHSDSIRRLMNAKSELDSADKHPLLPLSIGQIGLVGGSGMINGLIECDTPHVIKGRIIKVKTEEREEKYSSRGMHMGAEVKEVISNKMVFNVLTPKGFKALT